MIADPFVWEEEWNKRVIDKIDTERPAEKMIERAEREEPRQAGKGARAGWR